ncbi:MULTISPECIES: PEP-CTERM sorting domain-containing protein [unclassified Duganella]|uniref:PEP-CTERM sorting domain-containing protein n=1 Tax=unclassified Duganella TaxID=2636909 RepID=UPI00087F9C11|nr:MULTISPECIES: PEP-CTERM sorting domain-containing protein [unclassified Duganella]SDG79500.1 PEP-CTERM protein-sorting domain-containing protein [Duganella sp. OV458]SDK06633.1 PEP-CTERM protein-sorting domain-containing protein [Duganella sp. OV510]
MNKFFRAPLAFAFAVGMMSSAQAVNYVSVAGNDITFYYDADFWGLNAGSVSGNSISFGVDPSYSLLAKVASNKPAGTNVQTYADSASAAVIAVAHNGYVLNSAVGFNLQGSYGGVNGGSAMTTTAGGDIYGGTFASGVFNSGNYINSYSVGFASDAQSPAAGNINVSQSGGDNGIQYSALGLDALIYANVYQHGPGNLSLDVASARYEFSVSAVPEPETYGMLLLGLGALGFIARRKRSA